MTHLVSLVSRRIKILWILKRSLKNIVKIFLGTNMRKILKLFLAVNVWCKYFLKITFSQPNPITFTIATHARSFKAQKNGHSWCGTPQSQTAAVRVVMELSTKLTLSLPPSTMRMNVKQQQHQPAGFCQVNNNIKELKMVGQFSLLKLN